eukprot:6239286-Amphidinium_carterae.1
MARRASRLAHFMESRGHGVNLLQLFGMGFSEKQRSAPLLLLSEKWRGSTTSDHLGFFGQPSTKERLYFGT